MSATTHFRRFEEAAGRARIILGMMSGTSLDGLDLALCRVEGIGPATRLELLHFKTDPYAPGERERLRGVAFREMVSLRDLTGLHGWLAERHAGAVLAALDQWEIAPGEVDCLASHGQTVYHAPAGQGGEAETEQGRAAIHSTLQIGDGDRLAVRTGIPALSDFRQKEISGGGEGAPLAPYAEAILFGGSERARLLLNLGGIANFSWLPAVGDDRPIQYGDTGPGNTLMDLAVRRYFPERSEGFDRDGKLAAGGSVLPKLLAAMKEHPYFARPCPKSTGPETFGGEFLDKHLAASGAEGAEGADLLATLLRLTAETIADTLRREIAGLEGTEIYPSGGGSHNKTLAAILAAALPEALWRDGKELGLPADAKEAVLFAVLANETLWGEGFTIQGGETARKIGFGKLSFPD